MQSIIHGLILNTVLCIPPPILCSKPLLNRPQYLLLRHITLSAMALKAVHVSDIPATRFDKVPDDAAAALNRSTAAVFSRGANDVTVRSGKKEFLVMGNRGSGTNLMQSPDRRMKSVKENLVASFKAAAKFPIDFKPSTDDCDAIELQFRSGNKLPRLEKLFITFCSILFADPAVPL